MNGTKRSIYFWTDLSSLSSFLAAAYFCAPTTSELTRRCFRRRLGSDDLCSIRLWVSAIQSSATASHVRPSALLRPALDNLSHRSSSRIISKTSSAILSQNFGETGPNPSSKGSPVLPTLPSSRISTPASPTVSGNAPFHGPTNTPPQAATSTAARHHTSSNTPQ